MYKQSLRQSSKYRGKGRFSGSQPNRSSSSRFKKSSSQGELSESSGKTYRSSSSRPSTGRRNSFKRNTSRKKPFEKTIDIQTFIQKASKAGPRVQHEIKHAFSDFEFCLPLQGNLKRQEYITPTPIQDQTIKPIMEGRDVIGLANTGTGKTAAFLLPLIEKMYHDKSQKVLIIAPTRELAIQIDSEFRKFSDRMKIYSAVCIGGAPINHQINNLRRKPNVVIGTPGRLQDLSEKKHLFFKLFNNVVLDEVDRMLDMGFIDIIKSILQDGVSTRQLLFFSATMPEPIKKLVHTFLVDPITVSVQTGQTTENVEQKIVRSADAVTKYDTLVTILRKPELKKVLIFNETKRGVEALAIKLFKSGLKVDSIHGNKRQRQRQQSLTLFRNNKINILVATDVAARGLDIKNITHVINYTTPNTYDDYIHRIGRTGRGVNTGTALTFV